MKFKCKLDDNSKMPTKAHEQDAGFDIYTPKNVIILGYGSDIIHTGVHIEIPTGYCGLLVSKSGLNVKHGLTGTGLIDAGYTGEIIVKLYNNSPNPYIFAEGDKLIQMIILPVPEVELELDDNFEKSERGNNGFGSTGK